MHLADKAREHAGTPATIAIVALVDHLIKQRMEVLAEDDDKVNALRDFRKLLTGDIS